MTEKQQAMIKEGRIEVLGVEVVATGEDGDLLVGAPRERAERGAGGDGLDIDTAAGGDGPGNVAGAKPPPPPAGGPRGGNVGAQGPVLDSSFLAAQRRLAEAGPQEPTQLNVTLPEGVSEGTLQAGTISLNSPAVQAVPVTLVSASGRSITFNFPEGSTIPVGATSIPFTFTVADDGIISNGNSSSVALSIRAFASKLSAVTRRSGRRYDFEYRSGRNCLWNITAWQLGKSLYDPTPRQAGRRPPGQGYSGI